MIPEELIRKELEIRKAIARSQYRDLPRQLEDLRLIADEHIAALSKDDPLRREITSWTLTVFEWSRLMVATQRQIWSGKLERLPGISRYTQGRYLDHPDRQTVRVCLDL